MSWRAIPALSAPSCRRADAASSAASMARCPMLLRTQDSYTVAIEVALGSAMQNIVVEDEGCAKAAIQYLKRSDNGRATFRRCLSSTAGR